MDRVEKPICKDAEMIESYKILLANLQTEKDNTEKTNAIVINTYINKLKEAEKRLSYLLGKNHKTIANPDKLRHSNIIPSSSSHISIANNEGLDPNQKKVYDQKIDDLFEKNHSLKLENDGLKEIVKLYNNCVPEEKVIEMEKAHQKELIILKEENAKQIKVITEEKEKEINFQQNTLMSLQDQHDLLLNKCETDKKSIEDLNKKIRSNEEEKAKEIEKLNSDYATLKGKYDILNVLSNDDNKRIQSLNEEIKARDGREKENSDRNKEIEMIKDSHGKEIMILNEELKVIKERHMKEIEELNSNYQALKEAKDKEIEELNKDLKYEKDLKSYETQILKKDYDKLKKEYDRKSLKKKKLKELNKESGNIIVRLRKELNDFKEETPQKESLIKSLQEKTILLQTQLDKNVIDSNIKEKLSYKFINLMEDYLLLKKLSKYSLNLYDIIDQVSHKYSLYNSTYQNSLPDTFHAFMFKEITEFISNNPNCNTNDIFTKYHYFLTPINEHIDYQLFNSGTIDFNLDVPLLHRHADKLIEYKQSHADEQLELFKSNCLTLDDVQLNTERPCLINSSNGCTIKEEDLQKYSKRIMSQYIKFEMASITSLTIQGNINRDYLSMIAWSCEKLTSLTIESFTDDLSFPIIGGLIQSNTNMYSLHMTNCNINDKSMGYLSIPLRTHEKLQEIKLINSNITSGGIEIMGNSINKNKKSLNYIFDLSKNKINVLAPLLKAFFWEDSCRCIKYLDLSDNPLIEDDYKKLGDYFNYDTTPCVYQLNLSNNQFPKTYNTCFFNRKNLEELKVNNCNLSQENMSMFIPISYNDRLSLMILDDNTLNDNSIDILCQGLQKLRLRILSLNNTHLSTQSIIKVITAIQRDTYTCYKLYLEGNIIEEDVIRLFINGQYPFNKNGSKSIHVTRSMVKLSTLTEKVLKDCDFKYQ